METRTIDADARIDLPPEFANATVVIDRVSATEIRIRKADESADSDVRFAEEEPRPLLSDRDRDRFLELLDNPPPPNDALKAAFAAYRKRRG